MSYSGRLSGTDVDAEMEDRDLAASRHAAEEPSYDGAAPPRRERIKLEQTAQQLVALNNRLGAVVATMCSDDLDHKVSTARQLQKCIADLDQLYSTFWANVLSNRRAYASVGIEQPHVRACAEGFKQAARLLVDAYVNVKACSRVVIDTGTMSTPRKDSHASMFKALSELSSTMFGIDEEVRRTLSAMGPDADESVAEIAMAAQGELQRALRQGSGNEQYAEAAAAEPANNRGCVVM